MGMDRNYLYCRSAYYQRGQERERPAVFTKSQPGTQRAEINSSKGMPKRRPLLFCHTARGGWVYNFLSVRIFYRAVVHPLAV